MVPTRKQEQQHKIRSSTANSMLMEAISVLNTTNPLLMASDPRHMLETIMKGCVCLQIENIILYVLGNEIVSSQKRSEEEHNARYLHLPREELPLSFDSEMSVESFCSSPQ